MGDSKTKPSVPEEAKRILSGLSSRYLGERLAVERQLQQMGPEAAGLLLPLLNEEANSKRKKRRLFWLLFSGGLTSAALVAVAILVSGHPEALGILGVF